MALHTFVFKIEGEVNGKKLSPESVKLRDLLPLLNDFESAVLITARHAGAGDADDLGFSLLKIEDASDTIILGASPKMYRATSVVSEAIATNDFSRIPVSAQPGLRKVWNRSRLKQWTFKLYSLSNGAVRSEISPERELLLPNEISGGTSLLAKINRVGGENDPTVQLVIVDGERITASVRSLDLAKRLGEKLYQIVSVEGEAVWDVENWTLKEFVVTDIGEYQETTAVEAFQYLSEVAGNHWDDIEPLEYVRELRAD